MIKKKFAPYILTLVAGIFLSSVALAHNQLESTSPENGAELKAETFNIEYREATWLIEFMLKDENEQDVALESELPIESSSRFNIPLPDLPAGTYTALWTVEGDDTHQLGGEVSFTVAKH